MEIFDTLELRWFIDDVDGAQARAAREWFSDVTPDGLREDRYLLTEREDLGIKLREGKRLETKYRLAELTGGIERWRKLSLSVDDPDLEKHGTWVRLEKERRSRRHGGFNVEVTALVAHGGNKTRRAVTIGFEGSGDEATLLRVASETLASAKGLHLGTHETSGYPRWLARGTFGG
jgi:hypothetical protein